MTFCGRVLKIALLLGLLLVAKTSIAAPLGWYVGGGPGVGINVFDPNFELFAIPDAAHGVLAGRAFVGYQFTPYVGLEAGYTNFGNYHNQGSNGDFICLSPDLQQCFRNPVPTVEQENLNVYNTIRMQAFDLSSLLYWPLTDHFSLFGRAGITYVTAHIYSKVNVNFRGGISFNLPEETTTASNSNSFWQHINPVLGIGEQYRLNAHWALRAEYDYFFPVKVVGTNPSSDGTLEPSIIVGSVLYSF